MGLKEHSLSLSFGEVGVVFVGQKGVHNSEGYLVMD